MLLITLIPHYFSAADGGNDRRVVYDDLEGQEYISPKGLEILRAQANIYNARNNYRLYTSFPNDILDELPGEFKETFGEGGFVRVGNDSNAAWVPVIVVGPFDVKPNPKMKKWMMMFKKVWNKAQYMYTSYLFTQSVYGSFFSGGMKRVCCCI